MSVEKVKVVKIDTDPAQTSVKELRQQLKQLKDDLLSLDKGTKEYNDTLRQAADIQHTLKEQMEELAATAMDFGQIASNCTKAVGGLVAGFQAANAVMNLFGIENEDVLKSLKKMQSLMALTQALPAIDNSIKAFKRLGIVIQSATAAMTGLSKALIASDIGAAIAAVGLLAANWDKVSEALKRWGILHEDTKKKLEEEKRLNEELADAVAKASGKYDEWARNNKISQLNKDAKEEYDSLADSIKGYSLKLDEITAKQKLRENQNRANWEALQKEGLEVQNLIKLAKDRQDAILADEQSYKKLNNTVDSTIKKMKELQVELLDASNALNPFKKAPKSEWEIEVPIKPVFVVEEEEGEDEPLADAIRKRVESTVQSLQSAFETEQEQYQREIEALKTALNTKLIAEEEYNRLSEALAKEHAEKQREIAIQQTQLWTSALADIGNVFSSIASTIDQGTEEGQRKYKALMYTSTIISTLAGVAGAISSAFMPVNSGMTIWGQIAAAAATSASVLASGIAQLIQIKRASSTSSLGGTSLNAQPTTSSINSITAPVQYTQDVQGASIESAISNNRVYVVESDITDTQRRVSVTESESRF